jgi:hypothetical protein
VQGAKGAPCLQHDNNTTVGLDLLKDGIKGLSEGGKLATYLGKSGAAAAIGFSEFAEKVLPGLGVAASLAALYVDTSHILRAELPYEGRTALSAYGGQWTRARSMLLRQHRTD